MPSRGDGKMEGLRYDEVLYFYGFTILWHSAPQCFLSTDVSNSSLCAAGNHVSLCCLVMDEHVYYLV